MEKVKKQMGIGRPDEFYKQIAEDYREFVVLGRDTNVRIGEKYGVSAVTASGWVKIARERGILEPKLKLCWMCHQPKPGQDLGPRVEQVFKRAESLTVLKRIEDDAEDYAGRLHHLIDEGLIHDESILLRAAANLRKAGELLGTHRLNREGNAAIAQSYLAD